MLRENKTELKRTLRLSKKGQLQKFVHEVYIRKDISCGWIDCPLCQQPLQYLDINEQKIIFIPDYDFLNNYFDILLNSKVRNVLITQTIVEQLRKESRNQFKKVKTTVDLESWRNFYVFPNEFFEQTAILHTNQLNKEDYLIQNFMKVVMFYCNHFQGEEIEIVIISQNQKIQQECNKNQIKNCDVFQFVNNYSQESERLLDFLGQSLQEIKMLIKNSEKLKFNHEQYLNEEEMLRKISNGEAFRGKIQFDRNNNNKALINSQVLKRQILIEGVANINRAIQGDIVCVELLDQKLWKGINSVTLLTDEITEEQPEEEMIFSNIQKNQQLYLQNNPNLIPTGKIKGILKRDLRDFSGELSESIEGFGVINLVDGRLPKVLIKPRKLEELKGKKILITIDEWSENSLYPLGHLIKIFGDSENVDVENEVILFEFNVETRQFSQKVIDCLPQQGKNWKIPEEEYRKRQDLREEFICSVDPVGCRDIDDALHGKILPNGNYEIGVHIADVTYFVRPDTPIDIEASQRCTTVYLVNQRTDMLPKLLTESLCSLVGHEERLAFSVVWEFDKQTKQIVNSKFHKSVIKSKMAYTYQQAYERICDQNDNSKLTKSLRILMEISQHLKQQRINQGALQLASTQQKFKLDDNQSDNPTDISFYDMLPTNSMVEEFMLLANISVAGKILKHFPTSSVLRKHSSPKPQHIKQLSKILNQFNYVLDYSSSKSLADSLDKIIKLNDPFFNKLVRILTTRCMHEAVYFCSADFDPREYRHYGLAAELYTHFTSPIRRYADVLVHRLLSASIGVDSLPETLSIKSKINKATDQINIKNRNARNASRASNELFSYLFFKNKDIKEQAIISSVQDNGFSLIVPKYGFEGFIQFEEQDFLENAKLKQVEEKSLIQLCYNNMIYNLFDWVLVSIKVNLVNYRKQVEMKILQKEIAPQNLNQFLQ